MEEYRKPQFVQEGNPPPQNPQLQEYPPEGNPYQTIILIAIIAVIAFVGIAILVKPISLSGVSCPEAKLNCTSTCPTCPAIPSCPAMQWNTSIFNLSCPTPICNPIINLHCNGTAVNTTYLQNMTFTNLTMAYHLNSTYILNMTKPYNSTWSYWYNFTLNGTEVAISLVMA